ncbi:MAG: DUF2075 domain-containing protein [Lachnospiraceae bacterium]|nr:DUF2075 domain-containing protein [Lachnospiraceae bacterium]
MIIYRESVGNFISQCISGSSAYDIGRLISYQMRLNGISYFGDSQVAAWNASLPEMARVLKDCDLDRDVDVAVEYKLVQSRDRIDFLICGDDDEGKENVIVIELKQWSQAHPTAKQYFVNTFGGGGEGDYWHPSYQAYNYAQILQNFNEYIRVNKVGLPACSYLHNMAEGNSVLLDNKEKYPLVADAPVFYHGQGKELGQYIRKHVKRPNKGLLYQIENSRIVPSKFLAKMLSDAIHGNPFFSYDEAQATSVAQIVETAVDSAKYGGKRTIIIKGGAGTGKSVVAINALGQMINNRESGHRLNAVYITANAAPRNLYTEELVFGAFTRRTIGELLKYPTACCGKGEDNYDCVLVDEAHRVFDFKGGVGLKTGVHVLDEIIHSARVSVFFIDEDQAVTRVDYATADRIRATAERMHSKLIEGPSLELRTQFRITGGEAYISFIKSFLGYNSDVSRYHPDKYEFKVFDSASELMAAIEQKDSLFNQNGTVSGKCRLVAGYTYEWVSKGQYRDGFDYDIILDDGRYMAKWNLRCHQVGDNYSWLNDPGSIKEVGCIHTAQGLDMNYCGVIIGKDLQYRDGKLIFDQGKIARSDGTSGIRTADPETAERLIRNTYHVLLTRGMLGTFVYCEDAGLREYLKGMLM